MAELRSVDPRTLQINPNNPRRTPVPPAMDEQLVASIKAVGIIQPPCVTQKDDGLTIVVGNCQTALKTFQVTAPKSFHLVSLVLAVSSVV